jgi:hypothetical protein
LEEVIRLGYCLVLFLHIMQVMRMEIATQTAAAPIANPKIKGRAEPKETFDGEYGSDGEGLGV